MPELNILLVGDLNPELDNFLRRADSETRLIRRIYKARGSFDYLMKQVKQNAINAIILNPLTGDPFQPVDREAVALISEVRRVRPHQVVFVLYADRIQAAALLEEHSGLDVAKFIEVDSALERDHEYFEHLRAALEKCDAYLQPEPREISFPLRAFVASLLVALYLVAIYATQDWPWLRDHSNRLGLYICTAVIVLSVCLALLKRKWQASALTVGAFGALLVIAQIIGN
jgi:hypothetical protein